MKNNTKSYSRTKIVSKSQQDDIVSARFKQVEKVVHLKKNVNIVTKPEQRIKQKKLATSSKKIQLVIKPEIKEMSLMKPKICAQTQCKRKKENKSVIQKIKKIEIEKGLKSERLRQVQKAEKAIKKKKKNDVNIVIKPKEVIKQTKNTTSKNKNRIVIMSDISLIKPKFDTPKQSHYIEQINQSQRQYISIQSQQQQVKQKRRKNNFIRLPYIANDKRIEEFNDRVHLIGMDKLKWINSHHRNDRHPNNNEQSLIHHSRSLRRYQTVQLRNNQRIQLNQHPAPIIQSQIHQTVPIMQVHASEQNQPIVGFFGRNLSSHRRFQNEN